MATIIEVQEDKKDCAAKYVDAALCHVRMVEHKLTEALEQMGYFEDK